MLSRKSFFAAALSLIGATLIGSIASAQPIASASTPPSAPGVTRLRPRFIPAKSIHSSIPPGHDPYRIEVKFRDGLEVELDASGGPAERRGAALRSPKALGILQRLRGTGAHWKRAVPLDRATLNRMRARAQTALHREIADFTGYFILELPQGSHAPDWMDALNALPEVELATPLPLPAPPPMPPDFEPLQGYLEPAPGGTDADFAWTIPGGTGEGAAICDLEFSWNLNHEDLPPVTVLLPEGSPGYDPGPDDYHGTAVLGEMVSLRNGWGTTGASYGARCYVAPVVVGNEYALAPTILLAASRLEPGDVMLIELQTAGPLAHEGGDQFGHVPCEWELSVYNAVLVAVGNGIHVIEGAGNGGQNLDDPIYAAGNLGHAPFLPENDSGAIIVGAGVPPVSPWRGSDRSRLSFSNYGSRVDLQGWGVDVPTTGPGDLYMDEGPNRAFTRSFGGTSSAAPNVASAVASLEGIVEQRIGSPVSPAIMRTVLCSTGSPQQGGPLPATEHIGPRPDLRAAYQILDAPVVSAPESIRAYVGDTLRVVVQAADLDGDPIGLLMASPLPGGAAFGTDAGNTIGVLEWAIGRGQVGSYSVTFTASNSQQASATTVITIGKFDRPPVITVPGGVWGIEGKPSKVEVSAADPNGDPILSFEASDLPQGATFIADSAATRAQVVWTPGYDQAGQYVITLRATSEAVETPGAAPLTGTSWLVLNIFNYDRSPILEAPQYVQGREAEPLSFEVTAGDPDGDPIEVLRVARAPTGAAFELNASNTVGVFSWLPGYDQSGTHLVQFVAENSMSGWTTTTLSIAEVDRSPEVVAPEEVWGIEGAEVAFDATAADPDGDRIVAFEASGVPPGSEFVVDPTRTHAHFSWIPHAGAAGRYLVSLEAVTIDRSNAPRGTLLAGTGSVRLTIESGVLPARVYLMPDDRTVRLATGRPRTCVQIEPLNSLFELSDVRPGTVRMVSSGTGQLEEISAIADKSSAVSDRDRNSIDELTACFAKEDLRLLFANLRPGRRAVDVRIEGRLPGEGKLQGAVSFDVVSPGHVKDARVTPNPASGGAVLSFRTDTPGPLRLRVFDVNGRLLRTAIDTRSSASGYHDVSMGSDGGSEALPTGIYFYKLETPEGEVSGRFVVVK